MKNEKILFHYGHEITYKNDKLNEVGVTSSTTLRNITSHNDSNCIYVKKFGSNYQITDIISGTILNPRSDGGGTNKWWFEFYDIDTNTLLATLKDENASSTFVDGSSLSSASSGIYIKIVSKSGNVSITDGDILRIQTDVDTQLDIYLSGEQFGGGELTLYVSSCGSTYYDSDLKYGGYRSIRNGTQKYPYTTINDAITNLGTKTLITILDSETYDENLVISTSNLIIQSEVGFQPTITRGIGQRVTREPLQVYNNSNAIFVNENGDDSNPGTWQSPKKTLANGFASLGSKTNLVYGGQGATVSGGRFNESLNVSSGTFVLDAEYGYQPLLYYNGTSVLNISVNSKISGWKFQQLNISGKCIVGNSVTLEIYDCSFINGSTAIRFTSPSSCKVYRNFISNFNYSGIYIENNNNSIIIQNNIIRQCSTYGIVETATSTVSGTNTTQYNDISDCTQGFEVLMSSVGNTFTLTHNFNSNTISKCTIGLSIRQISGTISLTANYNNNLFIDCTTGVNSDIAVTVNYSAFHQCTTDYNVNVTSANGISGDMKITNEQNYKFSIRPDSTAYKSGLASQDRGIYRNLIEVSVSGFELNGIKLDGQNQWFNGIYLKSTDLTLRNVNIENFIGLGSDCYYSSSVNQNIALIDVFVKNNGNGFAFNQNSNSLSYCIFFNNEVFGLFADGISNTINHCDFVSNQYGLYANTNFSSSIENSIFSNNSKYDIYSEAYLIDLLNNCFDGQVNEKVNLSSTDIFGNPSFISLTNSNLNIRTLEAGYSFNSICKNQASDGYDIGAYKLDKDVQDERWLKFQLANNPRKVSEAEVLKGRKSLENLKGELTKWGKDWGKSIVFSYADDDYQTEEQKDFFRMIVQKTSTLKEFLSLEERKLRLHFLPEQKILSGTGTVSSSLKTLVDSSLDLKDNKYRWFFIGIKFAEGTTGTINASSKTLTVSPDPSWTANQWKNYYLYWNDYYFRILSNTSNILTLSDPDGFLSDGSTNWSIENYFKINKHDKNTFHLIDDDNLLIDGNYSYYIDFLEVVPVSDSFEPKQPGFYYQKEEWKTGFEIRFEVL